MAKLLLVDEDPATLVRFGATLRLAGHTVLTVSLGQQGLDVLDQQSIDLVLSDLRLPDMSGVDVLRELRRRRTAVPFVIVTGLCNTRDVVEAMRLGAADVVEKPVFQDALLLAVETALTTARAHDRPEPDAGVDDHREHEAYAAARWARAIVPIIEAPTDPRTVSNWSRVAFASEGALRNRCCTAGISPRRSLVFARLLRAVFLGQGRQRRPENLLDVADRRTLVGLLRMAGLNPARELPGTIGEFLARQTLVRDPDALCEIKRAIDARLRRAPRTGCTPEIPLAGG